MRTRHQDLPISGPAREALQAKGQFWTPPWVAEAMVAYVLGDDGQSVFDPAVGAGAFLRAAKTVAAETSRSVRCAGTELDPSALDQARASGLSDADLDAVQIRDFVLDPPGGPLPAIVANPPYIRHHRLGPEMKERLRAFGARMIGKHLDGRAGYHVYFLLRALQLLKPAGRLAFIMPADTCEGIFASTLWGWVTRHYRLEAVVAFAPDASPFPGVDTNPLIFMIRNAPPQGEILWARCTEAGTPHLKAWVLAGLKETRGVGFQVERRELPEALATGLSRVPQDAPHDGPVLADFACVMRGIVTGANDFFHLTRARAGELQIPPEFLKSAIGRTRDLEGDMLTPQMMDALEARGRPSLLFCPDARPIELFPLPVQEYLRLGEQLGLPDLTLIATRRPWYKTETREVPPIIFAYLGRRHARFIRNLAGVVPLTCFHCVYPKKGVHVDRLWEVLHNPETIRNLTLVGKSYGGGAIKVEPRGLERLPLPSEALEASSLDAKTAGRNRPSRITGGHDRILPFGNHAEADSTGGGADLRSCDPRHLRRLQP